MSVQIQCEELKIDQTQCEEPKFRCGKINIHQEGDSDDVGQNPTRLAVCPDLADILTRLFGTTLVGLMFKDEYGMPGIIIGSDSRASCKRCFSSHEAVSLDHHCGIFPRCETYTSVGTDDAVKILVCGPNRKLVVAGCGRGRSVRLIFGAVSAANVELPLHAANIIWCKKQEKDRQQNLLHPDAQFLIGGMTAEGPVLYWTDLLGNFHLAGDSTGGSKCLGSGAGFAEAALGSHLQRYPREGLYLIPFGEAAEIVRSTVCSSALKDSHTGGTFRAKYVGRYDKEVTFLDGLADIPTYCSREFGMAMPISYQANAKPRYDFAARARRAYNPRNESLI